MSDNIVYSPETLRETLQNHFGFEDFLDYQKEVVQAIVSGGDYCIIMPTGAGKSICYQLPVLLKQGYGIVVSPLIALMKDQIDALQAKNIPAAAVNSAVDFLEQREILHAAASGDIKLLYVAPERFGSENFLAFLEKNPPEIMIVDEAHCISQWGHDFRPAYTKLGAIARRFNIPQVCAFTATATPRVREDIKKQLDRPEMIFHVAGFKRPNLSFKVLECRSSSDKLDAVRDLLAENIAGATIIYTATRKQVDELTGALNILGYHAGLSDEERTEIQDQFMTQKSPVMAATNAFGMGIDRSDVRRVIHYNMTGSLEAYYQEAGRAGRDGEPAECILLFSYGDKYVQEFLVEMSNPPPALLKRLYRHLQHCVQQRQTNELEISVRDLTTLLDAKSDSQVYSALRVLEHYQVISRSGRSDSTGSLQLRGNAVLLEQMHSSEKTQRSRFIHRVLGEYGLNTFQTTFRQLSELTQLNYDQLRRVMNFLNGDVLNWTPAPGSGLLSLTDPQQEELQIDFTALEQKRAFELGRLEDVISYAQTRRCRQAELIGYFGEKSANWQCQCCDNCDRTMQLQGKTHELSDDELDGVVSILECVQRFNGRFGRGKISLILCGARRTEILNLNLHTSSHFGVLRGWKQEKVLDYLRALEKAALLTLTGGEYPCLMMTDAGEDFIDFPTGLALNLRGDYEKTAPRTQRKTSRYQNARKTSEDSTVSPADGDRRLLERADLRESLRQYRLQMSQRQQKPSYTIFSDAVLDELVKTMPATIEECSRIKGIGARKIAVFMEEVLDIINRYRRENLL